MTYLCVDDCNPKGVWMASTVVRSIFALHATYHWAATYQLNGTCFGRDDDPPAGAYPTQTCWYASLYDV